MRILSVRAPWAWAIFHAGKDVENRSWPTEHRGQLGIHASGPPTPGPDDLAELRRLARGAPAAYTEAGHIIGVVDLLDIRPSRSKWSAQGSLHWRLARPRLLAAPIRCRGALGLWTFDLESHALALKS